MRAAHLASLGSAAQASSSAAAAAFSSHVAPGQGAPADTGTISGTDMRAAYQMMAMFLQANALWIDVATQPGNDTEQLASEHHAQGTETVAGAMTDAMEEVRALWPLRD